MTEPTNTPKPEAPKPRPVPSPKVLAGKPAAVPNAPAAPATPAVDDSEARQAAAKFGRVDAEGNVFVTDGDSERQVGQVPGAGEGAMELYLRRYLELASQVALLESRVGHIAPKDAEATLTSLREQVAEPAAVGDLPSLRDRLGEVEKTVAQRRAEVHAERAEAKAAALKDRTALIERAEKIAGQDPQRTKWKQAGEDLQAVLNEWKAAQRSGPRVDKGDEDALWKRFSKARTTFDKNRKAFFQELGADQEEARKAKEDLIKRAEALSSSTDWGPTTGAYRGLMDEWKAAGRAQKKVDDQLWEKFRAAQQVFFDRRNEANAQLDADYAKNLQTKLEILKEAEALVPVKDVGAAKAALRPLQDRWEEAGKVPRATVKEVEGRLRAVEQAIREADTAKWDKTDPEKTARRSGLADQLNEAIAKLEADIAKAKANGDTKKATELEETLTVRRSWLKQVN